MKISRRLSLQLTPLLDLLLIVIFAQYLEMEQKTVEASRQQEIRETEQYHEIKQVQEELKFTREVLDATQKFRRQAENQLAELSSQSESELSEAQAQQRELTERLADVSSQRDRMIQSLRQMFASSSGEITAVLEQLLASSGSPAPITQEKIEQLASQMSTAEPRDLATFLLAYEEIRKRCDVWEIHIDSTGLITLFDGQRRHSFRSQTADDFQRRMFDLYRSLPQPKGLVIMLVSYGEVRADIRQRVILSLPNLIERMQADSGGRARFEYAVIGYLPESLPAKSDPVKPE